MSQTAVSKFSYWNTEIMEFKKSYKFISFWFLLFLWDCHSWHYTMLLIFCVVNIFIQ